MKLIKSTLIATTALVTLQSYATDSELKKIIPSYNSELVKRPISESYQAFFIQTEFQNLDRTITCVDTRKVETNSKKDQPAKLISKVVLRQSSVDETDKSLTNPANDKLSGLLKIPDRDGEITVELSRPMENPKEPGKYNTMYSAFRLKNGKKVPVGSGAIVRGGNWASLGDSVPWLQCEDSDITERLKKSLAAMDSVRSTLFRSVGMPNMEYISKRPYDAMDSLRAKLSAAGIYSYTVTEKFRRILQTDPKTTERAASSSATE